METEALGQPYKKKERSNKNEGRVCPWNWPQSENGEQAKGAENRYASNTRGRACMHWLNRTQVASPTAEPRKPRAHKDYPYAKTKRKWGQGIFMQIRGRYGMVKQGRPNQSKEQIIDLISLQ